MGEVSNAGDMPLPPDRELLVWEKWIQIRKEETTKLGKKLKRAPVDLAMNLPEKVREDKERKITLEHAQIEKKPTTVRGSLYERPPRLKQRCYYEPVYEISRTKAELGHPRVIEHVGVPTYIQKNELGMMGEPQRNVCDQLNAEYKNYRQKREKDLAQNLRKIDPFKPDTRTLMVRGNRPTNPLPKIWSQPKITIDVPTNDAQVSISGVYAVRINNTVFCKSTSEQSLVHVSTYESKTWHENCTSWTYYFNVPIKRVGRGKLFIQNLGTVTLRYCWKKIKRPLQFIPIDTYKQVFFFNKNEEVLSPGQCKDICFTFIADTTGIHNEQWELNFLNICFFKNMNEKLIIDLCADAVENADTVKISIDILKTQMSKKANENLFGKLIDDVFDRVFANVPQTYPYKKYFLEMQLFIMKNPVCYYHQTKVAKLKDIYDKEMAPGQSWDLSICTWRKIMMSKEFDDRVKYFDELKNCHSECLKPWHEGDTLLKDKYRAVNDVWGQLADKLDKEYERITNSCAPKIEIVLSSNESSIPKSENFNSLDCFTQQTIRNIFFLHTYEHVATAIELCAGILSSLDSNRWIEFDFCRDSEQIGTWPILQSNLGVNKTNLCNILG